MTSSTVLPEALRAALRGAIDYAGLFPPAGLDMKSAVANYAAYRRGPDAWALGRFVVQAARLSEFVDAAGRLERDEGPPWRLSVLVGTDGGLVRVVSDFNRAYGARWEIDSVEARAEKVALVAAHAGYVAANLGTYVEIALDAAIDESVAAIRSIGARAKIRMGGTDVSAFPAADAVVRFLRACQRESVVFKATAGLHHPLRGDYRLTYQPDSPTGTMFGYLNLFVAAARVMSGADDTTVLEALSASTSDGIVVTDEGVHVGRVSVSRDLLDRTRTRFMTGFGSCSFREPLDDAARLVAA